LAARVGTSSQQISHLELGKRHLTVEWLSRLAAALECHPWAIVSDDPPQALTEHERLLLQSYRRLPADQQEALVDTLVAEAKAVSQPRSKKRGQIRSSTE